MRGAWDCIVVGAGPAGLSAAVYMGRFRRSTLVLDAGDGRWSYGQVNENYLGFPGGVRARRLHALGCEQARRFGVAFESAAVTAIAPRGGLFALRHERGRATARTVIWAAGVRDNWPSFPGVRRLVGRHLFWCIVCDGWRTREKPVLLLGRDAKAVGTALQFLTYTRRLTFLLDPGARLDARCHRKLAEAGIPLRTARVKRVVATPDRIERVLLDDGTALRPHAIFSLYGSEPRTDLLRDLPVALARNGHVRVDEKGRTSLPALFAAGDVTNRHAHQVVAAVFEGAAAAMAANHVLYPPLQRL